MTISIDKLVQNYQNIATQDVDSAPEVSIRGRVTYRRGPFFDVEGTHCNIQVYVDKERQEKYEDLLAKGNIINATGNASYSNSGHPTIYLDSAKTVTESQYDFRKHTDADGLDTFITGTWNRELRKQIIGEQELKANIASYLHSSGYLPVTTDVIRETTTNRANPFCVGEDRVLRTDFDFETRGYLLHTDKVFQMGKVFRNEGTSTKNSNEFTYLNAYASYTSLGGIVDDLLSAIQPASALPQYKVGSFFESIDAERPVLLSVDETQSIDSVMESVYLSEKVPQQNQDPSTLRSRWKQVRSQVDEPILFLGQFPSLVPLAKRKKNMPIDATLVWNGRTILHASSDCNTPQEQLDNWSGLNHAPNQEAEKRYLKLLEVGLPPFSSAGMSVDLLAQLVLDVDNVNNLSKDILS